MKKSEIKVGGHYVAKVSGKLTTVRVDAIRERSVIRGTNLNGSRKSGDQTVYDVTNLTTGRKTTFKSAAKFRSKTVAAAEPFAVGGEHRSDPTSQITGDSLSTKWEGEQRLPFAIRLDKTVIIEKEPSQPLSGRSMSPNGTLADEVKASSCETDAVSATPAPQPAGSVPSSSSSRFARSTARSSSANGKHVIVIARAGSGKTTTLVEGLKRVKGIPSALTPSPQQAAVWDAMEESRDNVSSICFCAFNKSIATELQSRVPAGCDAMTMHSMGYSAVREAFGKIEVSGYRVQDILCELLGKDSRDLRREKFDTIKSVERLVGLCKMNLLDMPNADELDEIAAHYDVELNGGRMETYSLVPRVLERCKDVGRDRKVDFDDMIWLPVVLDLAVKRYDLLLVDECQDLNKCQQQLALKAGNRLILCGDPKQAIYGFAGADSRSMDRMAEILSATERGCVSMPLTVTRRCGKAIVREANRIVPDFHAHELNCEGSILRAKYGSDKKDESTEQTADTYHADVRDRDMCLCRVNAPLVSQCFRFLKAGRKATIQGRDVGQGLISTVKKLSKNNDEVPELIRRLDEWLHDEERKELAKRNPSEPRLIALRDRFDCLVCFTDEAKTVTQVISKIEAVFTDDKDNPGIRLSSIHKAKGLEAERVFFLEPKGASCPHPMAKTPQAYDQEMNLRYVAITRAIETLVYVQ